MLGLLLCAALSPCCVPAGGAAFDAPRSLATLVDLPTERERAAEAKRLARIDGVSLDRWLEAMGSFGEFEPLAPGPRVETVSLVVDGAPREDELELYVPPGYDSARPAPLLLMLHGGGGSGRGQHRRWKEVADALGMLVLSPSESGEDAGYGFTPRERARPLAALRWARRLANVDENRVFVSGVSRGGHQAWDLALRNPDLFAGLFPFVGGPRLSTVREQNNLRYLENVVSLSIRDLQGAEDDPGLLFNLHLAFARLAKFGAPDAELVEFPHLGHDFRFERVAWKELLAGVARDPAPPRIVVCAADLGAARSHWVEITRFAKTVKENFTPRVEATAWNALDAAGRKKKLQDLVDEKTARLEVERRAPDRFRARGDRVTGFRLLLTTEMLAADHPLEVEFRGRTTRKRPRLSKRLLLTEFAERFDRTFLPVAEVRVGK